MTYQRVHDKAIIDVYDEIVSGPPENTLQAVIHVRGGGIYRIPLMLLRNTLFFVPLKETEPTANASTSATA